MTTASILIRCKNEEKGIGPTLDAVFAQDHPPHEVIVVDSGSTDATLDIVARYPVRLLHLAPAEWGYSRALNLGAGVASGDVIVCLSAHCVAADSGWLGSLVGHFDDPTVAGVWGPGVRPGRPLDPPGPPIVQRPGTYDFENRAWGLSNGNSAVRRSLWLELPFDEAMPATEDKAWARDAMARGYTIVHEPRAAVWHESHPAASAFRRNRAVQEGFALMFPDEQLPRAAALRSIPGLVISAAGRHARNGSFRELVRDVRRFPATLAAMAGGVIFRRSAGAGGPRVVVPPPAGVRPAPVSVTGSGVEGGPADPGGIMGKDPTDPLVSTHTRRTERDEASLPADGGAGPTGQTP